NGRPHEKVDEEVVHRLDQIFQQPDPTEQLMRHHNDIDTTWFGVEKRNNESVLHCSSRLLDILHESQTGEFKERFPHLVSFVGQTGKSYSSGKSTIIKMLMHRAQAKADPPVENPTLNPVPGLVDDNCPTTGDVHLYADPGTYYDQKPILYADSEGMTGGESTPRGLEQWSQAETDTAKKTRDLVKDKIIKTLTWATDASKRSREFAVKSLFPRILYTFSDVIVFVLREARTFETEVLKLLVEWAATSIDKSVNQPSRPHVIILLNAAEMTTDDNQWDPEWATKKLLDDYKDSVHRVPYLQRTISNSKLRKSVRTTKDLLDYYYHSVTVIKIPRKGCYMQIDAQLMKLSGIISDRCAESHDFKKMTRMLLNAERLPRYVNAAYDHFTRDLEAPFDFVAEARRHISPPQDFGGHVLNLMLFMYDQWRPTGAPVTGLFHRLALPVASCVMLAATRDRTQGSYSNVLRDTYKTPLCDAFLEFYYKWLRCSFQKDGQLCVNTKSSHEKGHQSYEGTILGRGHHQSASVHYPHSFEAWFTEIHENIEYLEKRFSQGDKEEGRFIPKMHRDIMEDFYTKHLSASRFRSHLTCVCCVGKIPEHALPCGHIICKACIQCFGDRKGQGLFTLYNCPLHPATCHWRSPLQIEYKPEEAGVRVLCLDGLVMINLSFLAILREIERSLGDHVPIQDFFDLIVGTSTGGILALGLGVKHWSVEECTAHFKGLCKQAFTKRAPRFLNTLTAMSGKGVYKSRTLENALQSAFDSNSVLYGGAHSAKPTSIRVAVTATLAREDRAAVLSNYNTEHRSDNLPYLFIRPQDPKHELKVWEAARATSAAPPYFKPFIQRQTMRAYTDGAIHHHCPVFIADQERQLLWEDVKDWPPDIVLSIGSGVKLDEDAPWSHETVHLSSSDDFFSRSSRPQRKVAGLGYLWRAANTIIEKHLDCEEAWKRYCDRREREHGDDTRKIRLNVHFARHRPPLDDVESMEEMELLAQRMVQEDREKVHQAMEKLIASSFYFESVGPAIRNIKTRQYRCRGTIRCRFRDNTPNLQGLGKILLRYCSRESEPEFWVRENYGLIFQKDRRITFPATTIKDMVKHSIFQFPREIEVEAAEPSSLTNICLCLQSSYRYGISPELLNISPSISGFPRELCALSGFILSSPDINVEEVDKASEVTSVISTRSTHGSVDSEPTTGRRKTYFVGGIMRRARSAMFSKENESRISFENRSSSSLRVAPEKHAYPVDVSELAGDSSFGGNRNGSTPSIRGEDEDSGNTDDEHENDYQTKGKGIMY
ncbi:hypothetical protein BBK36DRAFT_1122202, partial [Trichoderma citrinoviride]